MLSQLHNNVGKKRKVDRYKVIIVIKTTEIQQIKINFKFKLIFYPRKNLFPMNYNSLINIYFD